MIEHQDGSFSEIMTSNDAIEALKEISISHIDKVKAIHFGTKEDLTKMKYAEVNNKGLSECPMCEAEKEKSVDEKIEDLSKRVKKLEPAKTVLVLTPTSQDIYNFGNLIKNNLKKDIL